MPDQRDFKTHAKLILLFCSCFFFKKGNVDLATLMVNLRGLIIDVQNDIFSKSVSEFLLALISILF